MSSPAEYRARWFGNIRGDLLSGIVVALALIPEAITFSIIAGVAPNLGLFASFSIAVLIALTGGRPGMISAATAAIAVLMTPHLREHGPSCLLAATGLAGLIQIAAGLLRRGRVMRHVSKSVMTGFVNALAILTDLAQVPKLDPARVNGLTHAIVTAGPAIIHLFPRLPRAVPSPLVAILALTAVTLAFGREARTVGDMGALPELALPDLPSTFETLRIILPHSLGVAMVRLLERLMTQNSSLI